MSFKTSIALATLALISLILIQSNIFSSQPQEIYSHFQQWKNQHGLNFDPTQEIYRLAVFANTLKQINHHNSNPTRTYDMGLNQFSHLTDDQFVQKYLTTAQRTKSNIRTQKQQSEPMEILQDVDWEVLGKVSPVKNQGNCDAGYAFCSASLVESRLLMKNQGALLSEQQIIDCSADYTTFGCSSGSRIGTLNFAREKGLVLQTSYPYDGVKGQCKNQTGNYKIDFDILESNGCNEIKNNLYKSPMTIAVNAETWRSYKTGVYNGCTSTEVNHDVYLVGVSTTAWRVKNSWGVRWGEYGYIRLALGDTCGICQKTGFGIKA